MINCDHPGTRTYIHTNEDGTEVVITYCLACGMEWR